MHFGDVLIHQICKVEKVTKPPPVLIPTKSLLTIPENMVDSLFDDIIPSEDLLTPEEKLFLIHNADFFYHIYGYWNNYSNKAIRMRCTFLNLMRRSSQLQLNNDIYMRLQFAKQNQLERRAQGDIVRKLYLVE